MTRATAEVHYGIRRALALEAANVKLTTAGLDAELRSLDAPALAAFSSDWQAHPGRRVAWPWPDMTSDWRRTRPERFEVSVWSDGHLCALALGKPAPSAPHLSVHYLEGNPDPAHPLRGRATPLVLAAAEAYALALGKTELRSMDPLPALVPHYCGSALGFRLVAPPGVTSYCTRRIAM